MPLKSLYNHPIEDGLPSSQATEELISAQLLSAGGDLGF